MALAHILQYIAEKAEEERSALLDSAKQKEREILEESERVVKEYSSLCFEKFENIKLDKERAFASEMSQYEKRCKSSFYASVLDEIYSSFYSSFSELSDQKQKVILTPYVASLSEEEGVLVSYGTSVSILEEIVKDLEKNFSIEEGEDQGGGFYFKGDGYLIDCRLSTLVKTYIREKTEPEILKLIVS